MSRGCLRRRRLVRCGNGDGRTGDDVVAVVSVGAGVGVGGAAGVGAGTGVGVGTGVGSGAGVGSGTGVKAGAGVGSGTGVWGRDGSGPGDWMGAVCAVSGGRLCVGDDGAEGRRCATGARSRLGSVSDKDGSET